MGSRGRSIRLRIYFLVAIPLITMLGLFGYVAYTSINYWLTLDKAPSLIKATDVPMTRFVSLLQDERRAAVVYLSHPDAASLSVYQSAVLTTKAGALTLDIAINSSGTQSSTSPQESAAITRMVGSVNGMTGLRTAVKNEELTPLDALGAYTKIIMEQSAVFQAEANSTTDAAAATEGLGLIATISTREDISEQDAVLAGALASGSLTPADRVVFDQAAGRQQDDTALYTNLLTPAELRTFDAALNSLAPTTVQNDLTTVQQGVEGGAALRQLGLTPAAWQELTGAVANGNYQGGLSASGGELSYVQQIANDAKRRVWEVAGFGLAGLILTLLVSILLGRSINRRLTALRRSALTLAEEQLPAVVSRLRRGESVDVAAEAPPLRVGSDEIGQVGQAIDTVRQTAIRSAVDEARLRQGVNDMFRNLARRSQSLLQRQLAVLDGMERKATDPDVLEDLFKMDHLTTRMRRHAEGLIILSGAPPGRGWSAPVKLIDVMRGAISEVEDYARVTVSTQSRAALAGSAVTDVIHLLAELIENATTLSPPFTQVRVSGEAVASGFAIEIEDRGLGMTPQRMAELNERLAQPPEINPTNTEQLGLFVVGQLARRHGISVTLRQSPYGGTTAVALIPDRLIVDEGPTAITAGGPPVAAGVPTPNSGYGMNGAYPGNGAYAGSGAYASNGPYGPDGSYGSYGAYGPYGASEANEGTGAGTGAFQQPYGADGSGLPVPSFSPFGYPGGPPDLGTTMGDRDGYPGYGGYPEPTPPQAPGAPAAPGNWQGQGGPPGPGGWQGQGRVPGGSDIRISGPMRLRNATGGTGTAGARSAPGAGRGRHGSGEVPVVTDVPVTRPGAPEAPPFDVFTPLHRSEQGGAAAPGTGDAPYAQSYADPRTGTSDPQPSYGPGYGQPAAGQPAYGDGNIHGDGPGVQQAGPSGSGDTDYKGLPRRVRQASLAPQLRLSAAAGSTGTTDAGVPPAASASLSDMRNTLSAMQRGWQQGRSQGQQDTEGTGDGD
jgi:signal transduction histidine kinase